MGQFSFPVSSADKRTYRKSFHENILMLFFSSFLSVIFKTIIKKGMDYKEIIKLWIGPKLMVFLADPRDIELILSSQVYLDKSPEYRFFKPWLGNGLLISSGKSRRNSISFSFPFLWPQQHIFCLFLNRLTRFKLILFSINNMRVEEEYLMKAISVNTGFLKEHLEPPCTTFRIFALQIQVKKHFREDDFDLMIKNFALECL